MDLNSGHLQWTSRITQMKRLQNVNTISEKMRKLRLLERLYHTTKSLDNIETIKKKG